MFTHIVVTGGAGFVGANVAIRLARQRRAQRVTAFDNLHRRGSELAVSRLRDAGVAFVHGDVRLREDLETVGRFDLMVECSAEPSVHAGFDGDPSYVVATNLGGTLACLEAVRRERAGIVFLSTSRVYPIGPLRELPLVESGSRIAITPGSEGGGWSSGGITADFPLRGHRSMYGATKLASELMIDEYRAMYGIPAIVTRFGVVAGPWQMGKVDQGFVTLWAARHLWGDDLTYVGFGGRGLQVRDVLHIDDVCDLVLLQTDHLHEWSGQLFNAGGGAGRSVSLVELTALCEARSGRRLQIRRVPETAPADVPYYVTDNGPITLATGWAPSRSLAVLLDDVFSWLAGSADVLRPLLG